VPFSFLFQTPPLWRQHQNFIHQTIPEEIKTWIYESGSLTQRLRLEYGSGVCVSILRQGWHLPFINECSILGIRRGHHAMIREVVLHVDNMPLILARSVIPVATIKIAQRNLSHIGNRPLGEIIFSYPNLHRLSLEIAAPKSINWSIPSKNRFNLEQSIWGRRTEYAIPTETMLVSEFFLPTLFK
jgi:chorismate lyase